MTRLDKSAAQFSWSDRSDRMCFWRAGFCAIEFRCSIGGTPLNQRTSWPGLPRRIHGSGDLDSSGKVVANFKKVKTPVRFIILISSKHLKGLTSGRMCVLRFFMVFQWIFGWYVKNAIQSSRRTACKLDFSAGSPSYLDMPLAVPIEGVECLFSMNNTWDRPSSFLRCSLASDWKLLDKHW